MDSGRFRKVKNPTATGTKIIKIVKHKSVYPIAGDRTCGVVTPSFVTLTGVPLAIRKPHTQLIMLAHPHTRVAITVIIIAKFLFCISFAPFKDYYCASSLSGILNDLTARTIS
jgi:hypothetical protein